jgi:hypothetical protein
LWVDAWTILELPESPILKVYPWHGAAAPLPPDALFVAAYNVFVGIDSFAEAAFLIQDGKDELRLVLDPSPSMLDALAAGAEPVTIKASTAVVARHQPDRQRAAAVMLDARYRMTPERQPDNHSGRAPDRTTARRNPRGGCCRERA